MVCQDPSRLPSTVPPNAQLPRTGIEVGMMLRLAALLAASGVLALVTTRRRHLHFSFDEATTTSSTYTIQVCASRYGWHRSLIV